MFERLRNRLLRLLRVPPEPEPPFGDPASIRVFRASRKLYLLRLVGWGLGQAMALAGILIGIGLITAAEFEVSRRRAAESSTVVTQGEAAETRRAKRRNLPPQQAVAHVVAQIPPWLFGLLWLVKGVGLLIYAGQLLVTYASVRLDYELRWYVVTDRSLRIRTGLWAVQEMTMSFANLQQVVVSQGPLQRLLGIADVRVQSAGGGAAVSQQEHGQLQSMHIGIFHGVDNAAEIRDLILDRLKHFRETGLGDPDEESHAHGHAAAEAPPAIAGDREALGAAQELLAEARRLRRTLTPRAD
jgi:membrane protein YdbS with pleckstrin-like domain